MHLRLIAAATLALAACHDDDYLSYGWDDRRILCSDSIDDLTEDVSWDTVEDAIAYADRTGSVALLHAHVPGETVSMKAIEKVLALADQHHLDYVRYDELDAAHPHRAGLALAFDDQATDAWMSLRDVLAAHGAHVTFFLTRYHNYTDEMRAQVAQLAADGHDIEAHTVDHPHANPFVTAHGQAAYLTDEVVPSFDILRADGYDPHAFAFPFGDAWPALEDAVLALPGVARIRLSIGVCPY